MAWHHHPDSPWGDIDICDHFCVRFHGSTNFECLDCDYPEHVKIVLSTCECIKGGWTYHIDGRCLACDNPYKKKPCLKSKEINAR